MIFKSLYDATKKVPNPNATEVSEGRTSVYDTWKMTTPSAEFDRPRLVPMIIVNYLMFNNNRNEFQYLPERFL
jgi:hypothetical protein